MQLLIDVFAILEPSFCPCSSKLYDLREDCSVYISFVLLDGQHASCFCLLSFHKNLRKCRSKPSANPASTKYNKQLHFSELNESYLLLFFLMMGSS